MVIKSKTIFDGKIAIIELRGSLIGDDGTDEFRKEVLDLIEQGNKCLVIDLQKVNYMNSSGVGALISTQTIYTNNHGEVKIVGLSKNILNLFVITKLVEVFEIHEELEEAIESFSKKKSINKINHY